MKNIIYAIVFLFPYFLPAQISLDWLTTLREERTENANFNNSFMRGPQTVVDPLGNVYNYGWAGALYYDLVLGEENLIAVGGDWHDFYVGQVNANGESQWLYRFSGSDGNAFSYRKRPHLLPQANGGIILVCPVSQTVMIGNQVIAELGEDQQLMILKIDPMGTLGESVFLSTDASFFVDVEMTANGDLLVAAHFNNFAGYLGNQTVSSQISPSYFLARITTDGEVKWATNVQPSLNWGAVGQANILAHSNGNIALAMSPGGYDYRISGCSQEPRVFILAGFSGEDGQPLWQREVASASFGHLTSLLETTNGDIYLVGGFGGELRAANGQQFFSQSPYDNCNIMRGYFLKTTADGQVYEVSASTDGMVPHKIIALADGYYLTVGRIERFAHISNEELDTERGYVVKVYDKFDRLVLAQNLATDFGFDEAVIDAVAYDEESIIVTARAFGNFLGETLLPSDILDGIVFWAKLHLELPEKRPGTAEETELRLFPNPTSGTLNIDLGAALFTNKSLLIVDNLGRVVRRLEEPGERRSFCFDLSGLPNGVYFLQIVGEEKSYRFVKH